MNGEEETVEVGDDTPSTKEQAKAQGWQADIFSFNKAEREGVELFNPGLVRRPDGLWLMVRYSEQVPDLPYGMNKIWACKLEPGKTPLGGPFLTFPDSAENEQFEDARCVHWNGQTWVGCVNFVWFPGDGSWWTGAHQMLGVFRDDAEWTPIARRDPIVGTNTGAAGHTHGKNNKNLLYWFLDGKLFCLYTSDPWLVVEFGEHWEDQVHHIGEAVKWKYGHVRGGTPPVQIGDLFYTFFHSSMDWRGRFRRYYMGALAFEARPPFKPVLWTQEPLLIGSQNDPWHQGKPLVVFPCGAVHENDVWLVTYGINDLRSGWIEIPHADLVKLLKPMPVATASLLLADQTPKPVYERIRFESRLTSQVLDKSLIAFNKPPDHPPCPSNVESVVIGTVNPGNHADPNSDAPSELPAKKPRGRPRKDGLPPGSVPKPPRKRRRRRKKALKSKR